MEEALRESEERYRELLELAPDAVLVHQDGRPVFANAAALELLGAKTPEEIIGRDLFILVDPADHELVRERVRRVLESGRVERREVRLVRLDGRMVVGETAAIRVGWKGRPAVQVIARDITERKLSEQALQRSERLLQDILDGSTNLIFVKDLRRRFVLVNRNFERAVGKSREELLGRTDHEVFPREWADYYAEHDRQVMEAGKPMMIEELAPMTDGTKRFYLSNKFPLVDTEGRGYGLCCIAMDINERKQMEQALGAAKEGLAQINASLERTVGERTAELSKAVTELQQFSYAIMHDLRAPLRAIHGFVTLMHQRCASGCEESLSRDFLERIQAAVGRMDNLITDSLTYSSAMRPKAPLHPVNLDKLVRGLIQSYPNLQSSRAEIQVQGQLPAVLGNEAGLVQCFSNLLGNAVKFVPPGTHPQVCIWSEPREGVHRICVEDNGIGIAPEHQERIFGMFQRLDQSGEEGTGIGLAVVRKVVERMGGRVGVDSELGKGSRFSVELKAAGL